MLDDSPAYVKTINTPHLNPLAQGERRSEKVRMADEEDLETCVSAKRTGLEIDRVYVEQAD